MELTFWQAFGLYVFGGMLLAQGLAATPGQKVFSAVTGILGIVAFLAPYLLR